MRGAVQWILVAFILVLERGNIPIQSLLLSADSGHKTILSVSVPCTLIMLTDEKGILADKKQQKQEKWQQRLIKRAQKKQQKKR